MGTTTGMRTVPRADLSLVDSDLMRRGRTIKRRREAHGIRSLRQWESLTGVSRSTITKAEAGISSEDKIEELEQILDALDAEKGIDTKESTQGTVTAAEAGHLEPGIIETVVSGPTQTRRWEVTFHSRPENLEQVTAQVERLLKALEEPLD